MRKMGVTRTLAERFHERHIPEPNTGCWLWMGAVTSKGYGQIRRSGKQGEVIQAHAASWEIATGSAIPSGMVVCHRCDNPPCVNPAHLFLGTHQDNSDDKWRKGRANIPVGQRVHCATLSDADVPKVLEALRAGRAHRSIAAEFGVKVGVISHIKTGRSWKHIRRPEQA